MKTYTYSEARQRFAHLLDQARREGQVQIRWQDGSTFLRQPVATTRSPLDVPGVSSSLRLGELVDLIRAERAGAGVRLAEALTKRRPRKGATKAATPPARRRRSPSR